MFLTDEGLLVVLGVAAVAFVAATLYSLFGAVRTHR